MQRAKYKTALGLAAILSLAGCAETVSGGRVVPNYVQEPPILKRDSRDTKEFLKGLGNDIAGAMNINGDFDYVHSELLEHFDKVENVAFYDILIRGYKEKKGVSRVECSINLDNMCEAYTRGRPIIEYIVGRQVREFTATGELVTCTVKPEAARTLDYIFNEYIKNNNGERCEDYFRHVRNNRRLPGGPRERQK